MNSNFSQPNVHDEEVKKRRKTGEISNEAQQAQRYGPQMIGNPANSFQSLSSHGSAQSFSSHGNLSSHFPGHVLSTFSNTANLSSSYQAYELERQIIDTVIRQASINNLAASRQVQNPYGSTGNGSTKLVQDLGLLENRAFAGTGVAPVGVDPRQLLLALQSAEQRSAYLAAIQARAAGTQISRRTSLYNDMLASTGENSLMYNLQSPQIRTDNFFFQQSSPEIVALQSAMCRQQTESFLENRLLRNLGSNSSASLSRVIQARGLLSQGTNVFDVARAGHLVAQGPYDTLLGFRLPELSSNVSTEQDSKPESTKNQILQQDEQGHEQNSDTKEGDRNDLTISNIEEPGGAETAKASGYNSDESEALPLKPVRPLSAYNLFFRHERARMLGIDPPSQTSNTARDQSSGGKRVRRPHRKTHGKVGFIDLARTMSKKWSDADKATRRHFEALAAEEMKKYKKAKKEFHKNLEEVKARKAAAKAEKEESKK